MTSRALTGLLHGMGAHADPVACIEGLSAELAARKVEGSRNWSARLVFHRNYWRDYERRRIRSRRPEYRAHNWESFPAASTPAGAQDWERLRRRFAELLADFAALAGSSQVEMQRQIETVHEGDKQVSGSLDAVLWQMIAHNSYHTGQIAMIRRMLGVWPPRAGGDTW